MELHIKGKTCLQIPKTFTVLAAPMNGYYEVNVQIYKYSGYASSVLMCDCLNNSVWSNYITLKWKSQSYVIYSCNVCVCVCVCVSGDA